MPNFQSFFRLSGNKIRSDIVFIPVKKNFFPGINLGRIRMFGALTGGLNARRVNEDTKELNDTYRNRRRSGEYRSARLLASVRTDCGAAAETTCLASVWVGDLAIRDAESPQDKRLWRQAPANQCPADC
jgi:hypothetical protein